MTISEVMDMIEFLLGDRNIMSHYGICEPESDVLAIKIYFHPLSRIRWIRNRRIRENLLTMLRPKMSNTVQIQIR